MPAHAPRILVFRMGAMGDILFTTPALRGLRRAYPNSHITFACLPQWRFLLRRNPNVDRIVGVKWYGVGALGRLRRSEFDILVNLQEGGDAARLCESIRARERRGNIWRDGRIQAAPGGFFISREPVDRLRLSQEGVSIAESFCRAAGVPMDDGRFDYTPPPWVEWLAERYMRRNFPPGSPKPIALHIHSRGSGSRSWSPKKAADLVRLFPDQAFLLFTHPRDVEGLAPLSKLPNVVVNHQSVPRMAALLRRCRLALCVDSGPRNIASAVGVPTLCLHGATHPNIMPARPRESAVQLERACSPCFEDQCPLGVECLDQIPVETIAKALRAALGQR
jgi:ADP-heptose:LPS heptosyltransferase